MTSLGWRRSGKGQPSRWHVGCASLCGVVSRSRVRRSSPWRRFCLTAEEGPPPDQGGLQILVGVLRQVLVPQIHEQVVAVVVPAVDVLVTTQLKFQQSLQYVFVKVPQIQFIVRLCEHSVVHRDGYSQCKLCGNRRIPQGSSWNGCCRTRCCATTGARNGPDSAEIVWRCITQK